MEETFPEHRAEVARVYELKATDAGREELKGRLTASPGDLWRELRELTLRLLAYSARVASEADRTVASGRTPLPVDPPDWRDRNARAYRAILARAHL